MMDSCLMEKTIPCLWIDKQDKNVPAAAGAFYAKRMFVFLKLLDKYVFAVYDMYNGNSVEMNR